MITETNPEKILDTIRKIDILISEADPKDISKYNIMQ